MPKEQIIRALKRASIIKQTEGGRSMVEMLGVLAVTGVLAVVGIMGFQNAMAKSKANRLISDIKLYALQCAQELYNRERHGEEVTEGTACGTNVTPVGAYALSGSYENTAEDGVIQISATNIPERVCETVADMGWQLPLSIKIGEEVLTTATCGEDNTISFNIAPDLSMVASGGTGGGDNTEGGNDDDAAGNTCGDTTCNANQYCADGECVCAYPCGGADTNNPTCCPEGTYCASESEDDAEYECITEEGCEVCENTTRWKDGATVSVKYCQDSEASCYKVTPDTCATTDVECGTLAGVRYCLNYSPAYRWWDSKSICEALGMRLPQVNELLMGWNYDKEEHNLTAFAQALIDEVEIFFWTSNLYNSCEAYHISMADSPSLAYEYRANHTSLFCVQ